MAEIDHLIIKLRSSRDAVGKEKAAMLDRIGEEAANTVRNLTPVDTGRLRESIHHEVQDYETVAVTTNVEYAPYVDQGHATRGGSFVPGHHMFEQGLLAVEDEMGSAVQAFLGKINILG